MINWKKKFQKKIKKEEKDKKEEKEKKEEKDGKEEKESPDPAWIRYELNTGLIIFLTVINTAFIN